MEKMVEVIPAKQNVGMLVNERPIKRVAAYARVSSLPQEESYESQVEHFTTLINEHKDWKLVKVYGDEGISGLNTKKRTGFKQMIDDGIHKKYDLLLAKSVSRLGRNTVDLLTCIRKLKAVGVAMYFEKENINTLESSGEVMITLLSAFAQSESESISQNVKIGFDYKRKRGEHTLAYGSFLGYDKGEKGGLVINPEQAETVKMIYSDFLSGVSLGDLCDKLKDEGRLTGTGGNAWTRTSVSRIIKNEKYKGSALLGKTYVSNVLEKKRTINHGEVKSYYIDDDHEPIVDKQTWFLAQGELLRRDEMFFDKSIGGPAVLSGKHDFTYKISCPICGANYNHRNAKGKYVWECYNRINGDCKGDIIPETELQAAVLEASQKLHDDQPVITMKDVPILKASDDENKLIKAAAIHSENAFAGRTQDLLKGERPKEYSSDLMKTVERIEIGETEYTISFYGDCSVKVNREARKNMDTGRRLKRS